MSKRRGTFLPWSTFSSARIVKYLSPPILIPLPYIASLSSKPLQIALTSGPLNCPQSAERDSFRGRGTYHEAFGNGPRRVPGLGVDGRLIDLAGPDEGRF